MGKFKEGDIVQLKSGGPKMTIMGLSPNLKYYICQWFSGSKLEQGNFPENSLIVPPSDDKGKK